MMQRQGKRRGFTLVELAIVLAVASLLFGGLWRLMSSGSTQLRDQAVADQQKKLIDATRAYLQSNDGTTFISTLNGAATANLPLRNAGGTCTGQYTTSYCDYLPAEFTVDTQNAYGQKYVVYVRKDSGEGPNTLAKNFSFMVGTYGGETIPDTSGGRISSMIGGDGGFVYTTDLGSGGAPVANGSYGAWNVNTLNMYGYGVAAGHIASRTYAGLNAEQDGPWLARKKFLTPTISGLPDLNTLQTNTYFLASAGATPVSGTHDLFLGNNTLFGATDLVTKAGAIKNILRMDQIQEATFSGANETGLGRTVLIERTDCSPGVVCNNNALVVTGDGYVSGLWRATELWAGKFIYDSDERLKHDIVKLPHALDDLSKIRGLSFTMNESGEKKLGVLAQEVEKIYPQAVSSIGRGYKGVDYIQLIGPLVAAVNELRERNDALEKKVADQALLIQKMTPVKKDGKK